MKYIFLAAIFICCTSCSEESNSGTSPNETVKTTPIEPTTAAPFLHHCQEDAIEKANRLIRFHFGEDDDRISVDNNLKVVAPITNPANKSQKFDVLEVWAYIYKGKYRMHFLYAQMDVCVLMGQEILEFSSL